VRPAGLVAGRHPAPAPAPITGPGRVRRSTVPVGGGRPGGRRPRGHRPPGARALRSGSSLRASAFRPLTTDSHRENGHRGPRSVRQRRENGVRGPTSVRQPAGRRLSEAGPPQVNDVLPGQVQRDGTCPGDPGGVVVVCAAAAAAAGRAILDSCRIARRMGRRLDVLAKGEARHGADRELILDR
jgi:hypothetical protein